MIFPQGCRFYSVSGMVCLSFFAPVHHKDEQDKNGQRDGTEQSLGQKQAVHILPFPDLPCRLMRLLCAIDIYPMYWNFHIFAGLIFPLNSLANLELALLYSKHWKIREFRGQMILLLNSLAKSLD